MQTLLLFEENQTLLDTLKDTIEQKTNGINILAATNYESATHLIYQKNIQLFLIDMEVHKSASLRSAMAFGQYIRSIPQYRYTPIVLIDPIKEHLQAAINKLHCQYFLLKPFRQKELIEAIIYISKLPQYKFQNIILYDTFGVSHKIAEQDICFINSEKKNMQIHILEKKRNKIYTFITNRYRLSELQKILSTEFVRCHKSYIVNRHHITHYDKTTAIVQLAGYDLPVGRHYKSAFEQSLIS